MLAEFQQALADLTASPDLCNRVRQDFEVLRRNYDLSEREWRRFCAEILGDAPGKGKQMTRKSRQRGGVLAWTVILVAAMALAYWMGGRERAERTAAKIDATPRAVLARGDLAADEQSNVEVFRASSPSVVNITTLQNATST